MGHAWNRSDNKKAFIEGLSWLGEAAGVIAVLQLILCLEAWVAQIGDGMDYQLILMIAAE